MKVGLSNHQPVFVCACVSTNNFRQVMPLKMTFDATFFLIS
jgi:hypothetical protein